MNIFDKDYANVYLYSNGKIEILIKSELENDKYNQSLENIKDMVFEIIDNVNNLNLENKNYFISDRNYIFNESFYNKVVFQNDLVLFDVFSLPSQQLLNVNEINFTKNIKLHKDEVSLNDKKINQFAKCFSSFIYVFDNIRKNSLVLVNRDGMLIEGTVHKLDLNENNDTIYTVIYEDDNNIKKNDSVLIRNELLGTIVKINKKEAKK